MDLAIEERQLPSTSMESEGALDVFTDFSVHDSFAENGEQLGSPLSGLLWEFGDQPDSDNTTSQICLRAAGDVDNNESFCFCNQCLNGQYSPARETNEATSLKALSSASTSTTLVASDHMPMGLPLFSSPIASASSPSRLSSQHKSTRRSINKSKSHPQMPYSKELVSQLEAMIQDDMKASTEFKWKSSILFHELKRLIDNEHASRLRPIPKKKVKQVEASDKIFQCTALLCGKSSAYPLGWKRHEETHWPQSRYMCLHCPVSTPDVDFPDALQCIFCSVLSLSLEDHHHHLLTLCDDSKEKGRVFIRKDKLIEHLQKQHSITPGAASDQAEKWKYHISSNWPRHCGFCQVSFTTWDQRAEHLVEEHFKKGANIGMWKSSTVPTVWPMCCRNSISIIVGSDTSEITPGGETFEVDHQVDLLDFSSLGTGAYSRPQTDKRSEVHSRDSRQLIDSAHDGPEYTLGGYISGHAAISLTESSFYDNTNASRFGKCMSRSKIALRNTLSDPEVAEYSEHTDFRSTIRGILSSEHNFKICSEHCKKIVLEATQKRGIQAKASEESSMVMLSSMAALSLEDQLPSGHSKTTTKLFSKKNSKCNEEADLVQHHHDLPCSFAVLRCNKRFPVTEWKQWLFHDFAHFETVSRLFKEGLDHLSCPECGREFEFQPRKLPMWTNPGLYLPGGNFSGWVRRSLHIAMHIIDEIQIHEMPPDYCLLRFLSLCHSGKEPLIDSERISEYLEQRKDQSKNIKVEFWDNEFDRALLSAFEKLWPDNERGRGNMRDFEWDYWDWGNEQRRERRREEREEARKKWQQRVA